MRELELKSSFQLLLILNETIIIINVSMNGSKCIVIENFYESCKHKALVPSTLSPWEQCLEAVVVLTTFSLLLLLNYFLMKGSPPR